VPQDVEAEDKLIGPFTFRQFVYLIIVALAGGITWGLAQLFLPLAIIPLPVIIFFGALALPLRKDQPMEVYLAAVVSFLLKTRKRLWESDGIESLIEITVPKLVEPSRIKDLSQGEVQQRFSYLAQIADTQGWAVRGQGIQAPNSSMRSDIYFASQQVEDVLDNDASVAHSFDQKLDQSDAKRHQEMVDIVRGKTSSKPTFTPTPKPIITDEHLEYNPYPDSIQQTVIQPLNPSEQLKPEIHDNSTTSDKPLAPGIINLASNTDLSIEAIAREANRIQDKHDMGEEVVISLR
ncbi:PrgI family protein, partial [Candidatus Saccharibacteria bacterium]|nr:PrgI family protein [Candidatus Saccharibacteria bacterium]